MKFYVDAEGFKEGFVCPQCGSTDTITYRYVEGFEEHECPHCGYEEGAAELDELTRYQSELLERDHESAPPIPRRSIEA